MIRLFVRLGKWLEVRFPAKFVVTAEAYAELKDSLACAKVEIDLLRSDLKTLADSHNATVDRVSHVEASAVHKGAVGDLVGHVQALKNELTAIKANLGWNRVPTDRPELEAMLNGEIIDNG
jgi:hypothetical protein